MTIGIGGWGSRRKPMALVRAIAAVRPDRPDRRLLRRPRRRAAGRGRAGAPGGLRLRVARQHPARAALPAGPAGGHGRADRVGRGHALLGTAGRRAPAAVPADPGRPRLRRACGSTRSCARSARRTPTTRSWSPCRPCRWTPRWSTSTGPTPRATGSTWARTRTSTTCSAWPPQRRYLSCERLVATAELLGGGPPQSLLVNRMMVDGVVATPHGAHFTSCVPDYGRDEAFQRDYATAAASPPDWAAVPRRPTWPATRPTTRRRCGRDDGSHPGGGLRGRVRRGVARRRRDPGQPDGARSPGSAPGWPGSPSPPTWCSATARPTLVHGRRRSRAGCRTARSSRWWRPAAGT